MHQGLVKDVCHTIRTNGDFHLHWTIPGGLNEVTQSMTLTAYQLAAIETWLAQSKPPTPEERAEEIADWYFGKFAIKHHPTFGGELVAKIAAEIRAAIKEAEAAAVTRALGDERR